MSRTIVYVHVNIILDFPVSYTNASVHCQSECPWLHKTVNMFFSLLKVMKIPTQKGEHSGKCTELSLKRKEGRKKQIEPVHIHTW